MVHAEYFVCMDIIIKERVFTGSHKTVVMAEGHIYMSITIREIFQQVVCPLLGISLYTYPLVQVVALV